MKLENAIRHYLDYLETEERRPQTIENYRAVLDLFLRFTGDIDIAILEPDTVIDFAQHVKSPARAGEEVNPLTVLKHFAAVRTFYDWLSEQERVGTEALSSKEYARILRQVKLAGGYKNYCY
jgi:site-specific recombinase XerC